MNYYNEWDKYAAGWLRNLQTAGHIPQGQVDERSIRDVRPEEIQGATQAHFFAGIGGWPYALKLAGWPDDLPVWTGSCPCQPFSAAGQRKGTADERHLWPEFLRLIAVGRPSVVFGEQVASKDGREWLVGVRADLEELGYAVGAADLCAAGVGAPHIRQRLYWVAQSYEFGGLEKRKDSGRRGGRGQEEGLEQRLGRSGAFGGRMDNAMQGGRGAWAGQVQAGRDAAGGSSEDGCMEHPEGEQVGIPRRARKSRSAGSWLGDPSQPGLEGRNLEGNSAHERTAWTPSVAIPCIDGKARRIEPGTFPLAHGVPDRVGKLRAYGNAIVPQVAAEFIRAFMETRVA